MIEPSTERLLVELTEFVRSRFFGKYRGTVHEIEDSKIGRIKAIVPEIYGDVQASPWALPSLPFAGKDHGCVLLPEIGDGVWIEFEAGDLARPIWTGFWWARDEMPELESKRIRALITTTGHKIILDDDGAELKLVHSGGAEIAMTDNNITLRIGATQIVLSSEGVNVNNGALMVK